MSMTGLCIALGITLFQVIVQFVVCSAGVCEHSLSLRLDCNQLTGNSEIHARQ